MTTTLLWRGNRPASQLELYVRHARASRIGKALWIATVHHALDRRSCREKEHALQSDTLLFNC